MFSRSTIAGQPFQSGEINGARQLRSFPQPYAPFTFIKAIPSGASYPEPVTSMTVEIRTSSSLFSGTDDDVYLRVSPTQRFALDKRLYDDFERGDRDTYSVPIDDAVLDGLSVGDIDRVQIEKSSDGVGGGWKLRGVKLVVNGRTLYARDHIDRWLEDNHRTWRAPDFRRDVADRCGPADHARPVGRGLVHLRRQRPRRHRAASTGASGSRSLTCRARLRPPVGAPRDRRQPARRTPRRRRRRLGHLHDRDADADGRPADRSPPVVVVPPVVVEPPPPPPPPVQKPDLVISAMGYSDADKYFFTVKNQGDAATRAVQGQRHQCRDVRDPRRSRRVRPRREPSATLCQVVTNVATADVVRGGRRARRDEQHAQLHRGHLHPLIERLTCSANVPWVYLAHDNSCARRPADRRGSADPAAARRGGRRRAFTGSTLRPETRQGHARLARCDGRRWGHRGADRRARNAVRRRCVARAPARDDVRPGCRGS